MIDALSLFIIPLLLLFLCHATAADIDFCASLRSGDADYPSGQKHSVPKMHEGAGIFFNVESANGNLSACIDACCETEKCHVAYIYGVNDKCYSLQCHSYELCQPEESNSSRHGNSTFVWVRQGQLKLSEESEEFADYDEVCGDDEGEKLCRPGLFCFFDSDQTQRKCYCNTGEHLVREGECVETAVKAPAARKTESAKVCESGLHQCGGNEVCLTENHARKGACACMKGLERDSEGLCVHPNAQVVRSSVTSSASVAAGGGGRQVQTTEHAGASGQTKTKVKVTVSGLPEIQLPVDSAELHAIVEDEVVDKFSYSWKTESEGFVAEGWDKPDLKLTKLRAGTINFRVTATGKKFEGAAEFTLNVLAEKVEYDPPVAVIDPASVTVEEGTQIVLDAKKSEDKEGKGLTFTWSQKSGPAVSGFSSQNANQITLPSLKAGNYTFGLTVTSASGLTAKAEVKVFVKEERDDPPEAVVGKCLEQPGDFTVSLPQDQVFICGNRSHDDKKIVTWTWTKIDDEIEGEVLPADLTGTNGPVLTVSKIKPGTYAFELKVTDEKKQADQKTIRMHVNAAANKAPIAKVGANQTVVLPTNSVILDGSQSTDDNQVTSFSWTKISGPGDVIFANQYQAQATASELKEGLYQFRLNVSDAQGLSSYADAFVFVNRSKNTAPVAVAEDLTVNLPINLVILDGSRSYDDAGIIKWSWDLLDNSSSVLTILGNTSQGSALNLTNLIEETYWFNFTVFDQGGLKNSKIVHLTVRRSTEQNESVEMYLSKTVGEFTDGMKRRLRLRLETFLSSALEEASSVSLAITQVGVDHSTGRVRIVFHCTYDIEGKKLILEGSRAVELIKSHDLSKEFRVYQVDTLYCSNPCSGHGECNDYTKECTCESYWMPNLFTYYILGRKGNCNWSVLYFVIISVLLASTVAGTLWAMICTGKKICPCSGDSGPKPTKRRKYRMLNEKNKGRMGFKKSGGKNGAQMSSLLISDSNFSDSEDEETLFDKNTTSGVKRTSSSNSLLSASQKVKA